MFENFSMCTLCNTDHKTFPMFVQIVAGVKIDNFCPQDGAAVTTPANIEHTLCLREGKRGARLLC